MAKRALPFLTIDGSYGEGGGQILRTSLALSAVTGTPIHLRAVRAARRNPGLAPQHLLAVRAVAELCGADVTAAALGSQTLEFVPRTPPKAGEYAFDVASVTASGSAGSALLVLQAVLMPLAVAEGDSLVVLRGGTHVPMSPSFDYVHEVWLPALRDTGVDASVRLVRTGWYPAGGGELTLAVRGRGPSAVGGLRPVDLRERGRLLRVSGRALAANLPRQVPQRMAARARTLLEPRGVPLEIAEDVVTSNSAGAAIFLCAEYEHVRCGFTALGERGKPSEAVAQEAAEALRAHDASGAAVDVHLADQLLVPLALAERRSQVTTPGLTGHLRTNAHVVERFGLAAVETGRDGQGRACVTVAPTSAIAARPARGSGAESRPVAP